MSLAALEQALQLELDALKAEGRTKPPERVIAAYLPPQGEKGPRYRLRGSDQEFIRMNSNSYLSLSHHPELIEAAEEATRALGVGPGAVRFIDGTFSYHAALEVRIAAFAGKPAAKIFNSAYTANCGLALAVSLDALLNAVLLLMVFRRVMGRLGLKRLFVSLARMGAGCVTMAAAAWWIGSLISWDAPGRTTEKIVVLTAAILGSLSVYLVTTYLIGSRELGAVVGPFVQRFRNKGES
jgi:hypothetical protein